MQYFFGSKPNMNPNSEEVENTQPCEQEKSKGLNFQIPTANHICVLPNNVNRQWTLVSNLTPKISSFLQAKRQGILLDLTTYLLSLYLQFFVYMGNSRSMNRSLFFSTKIVFRNCIFNSFKDIFSIGRCVNCIIRMTFCY